MAGVERFQKIRVNQVEVTGRIVLEDGAEIIGIAVGEVSGDQTEQAPQPLYVSVDPIADSEATTVKQIVADHNALLAALRDAGVILLESPEREPAVTEVPEDQVDVPDPSVPAPPVEETPAEQPAEGDNTPQE